MKRIRFCVGSNDGESVANTHMGDTEYFHIYDLLENSEHEFIRKQINTAKDMEHAKETKMMKILEIVEDVDVLVARQKSQNFVKIASETRYQPVVVKTGKIPDALIALGRSFQEIYGLVERRRTGECFDTIPEFE